MTWQRRPQAGELVLPPPAKASGCGNLTLADFPNPDGAVVVCRDLSGYFRDCGCSGGTGGVARFHGVTADAARLHVVFAGRSIIPPFTNNQHEAQRLLDLRAPAMIDATNMVWKALGSTTWLAQEAELASLKAIGADVSILGSFLKESPVRIGPLEISGKTEYVIVNGTQIQLPRADTRDREVLVLAWWGSGDGAHGGRRLDRTLGALVSLTRRGEAVMNEIKRILAGDELVWTYWLAPVTPDISEDIAVAQAVDAADLLLSHAPESVAAVSMPFSWRELDKAWTGCRSCHEKAYDAWKVSKHHVAFKTLTDRRRHQDIRCITCHVQEFKVSAGGLTVAPGHGAVTCGSCHEGGNPKLACVRCHTDVTDPAKKYAAALNSICPGDTKAGADKCARR